MAEGLVYFIGKQDEWTAVVVERPLLCAKSRMQTHDFKGVKDG